MEKSNKIKEKEERKRERKQNAVNSNRYVLPTMRVLPFDIAGRT
jgi:hypothetical protein